jgi:hypothetical protein
MKITTYNELLNIKNTNPQGAPGFHGDLMLIDTVDECLKNSTNFIETGTNMGNTLYFVSRNYSINSFSCEIHNQTPTEIINYDKIVFENTPSPNFIYDIVEKNQDLLEQTCTFWLDAHFGGGENILFEEIEYIVNNFKSYYAFCDDVDINNSLFSHNGYGIEQIKKLLPSDLKLYIPNYSLQTSEFHGLTGWCFFTTENISNQNYIKLV